MSKNWIDICYEMSVIINFLCVNWNITVEQFYRTKLFIKVIEITKIREIIKSER